MEVLYNQGMPTRSHGERSGSLDLLCSAAAKVQGETVAMTACLQTDSQLQRDQRPSVTFVRDGAYGEL